MILMAGLPMPVYELVERCVSLYTCDLWKCGEEGCRRLVTVY